jgi:Beta-lactamase
MPFTESDRLPMTRCGGRSVLIQSVSSSKDAAGAPTSRTVRHAGIGANILPKERMKHLANAILILLCLSAVAFGYGPMTVTDPESLGFSTTRLARIASWYNARVEAGDLRGAVVAIARNGKLAYLKAIGFQDRRKTIPMNPNAIFWIASMTKPVTSVAAMMRVEEGSSTLTHRLPSTCRHLRRCRSRAKWLTR